MNSLIKFFKKIENKVAKMSVWLQFLIVLAIMFVLIEMYKTLMPKREGFIDQKNDYVIKKGINLYDDFYVNIYDELFYKDVVNTYEVGSIENITKPTSESKILVIGNSTGNIANQFQKKDMNVTSLQQSSQMVKYSKQKYPRVNFKLGDPEKSILYERDNFTHILCLNMDVYYFKNKMTLFQNIYDWLMPGGYFVVQLVDKNKFDPIIPSAKPFVMVNPQSFSKKRITTSAVTFNNFGYTGDFQIFPNDVVQFREIFKDTTPGSKKVRENIHKMWIPSRLSMVNQLKEVGFVVLAQVDLLFTQKEYQYLYMFQKPS
jgi:SAM-dependent methyltransferase